MMNGLGMMLKSMGIDPESITETASEMAGTITRIEEAQKRIEEKQDRILQLLSPYPTPSDNPVSGETEKTE